MKIEGTTTTEISNGSQTSTVSIDGNSVSAYNGMVVFYNNKEFVWVNSAWKELGDESSFMLKGTGITNISINGYTLQFSKEADGTLNLSQEIGLSKCVYGAYTGNGGSQNPNYFGTNKVGFLMMHTTVNNNS
jgi:hypothetical protein